MAQLVIIDGPEVGSITPLTETTTVGQSAENHLVIDDASLEGIHARIERKNEAFQILPFSDSCTIAINGIVINGEEQLNHGDLVSLGDVTLLFSDETSYSDDVATVSDDEEDEETAIVRSRVGHFQSVEEVISTFRSRKTLNEHLETLYRVGAALNATLDLPQVVEELLNILFEFLEPDRAFVYLFDDQKRLELKGQRISPTGKQTGFTRISKTILNETLQKREAILTEDASQDQRFDLKQSIVDQEIHSAICVPLIKKDQILGVIYLDQLSESQPYREDELNLINGIATQAALAIENVLHYHRTVSYSRTLARLGQFSRKISSYLSRKVVIREAIEYACELFHCRKGSILLKEGGGKKLQIGWSTWIDQHVWSGIDPQMEETFCGKVLAENKPMLVTNCSEMEGTHPERKYESSSFLIVPIPTRTESPVPEDQSMGVITLTDRDNKAVFTQDDLEFLTVFAAQVGIALQNANLFERATVDTLTKLRTRQFFFAQTEELVKSHTEKKLPLSLLMVDMDDFKKINDTYGHQTGDVVLAEMGKRIRQAVPANLSARFGGEEVVLLLPGQDRKKAFRTAEKLCSEFAGYPFPTEPPLTCTVSIGVGELVAGDSMSDLIEKADFAMYEAKKAGKNQAKMFEGKSSPGPAHRMQKD